MAAGDATSGDCPGRYDVVINGKGYMLLQTLEPSLPFRTHRAVYSYSPTFVDRSNVSNAYGDNAQDFFLTVRQRDWSLGEQQKYYRSGQDGRYWAGAAIDNTIPGQLTLRRAVKSVSFSESVSAVCQFGVQTIGKIAATGPTSLFTVDETATTSLIGSHGLGVTPTALINDSNSTFISATAGGTVGVRRYTSGATFTTWSTSAADTLAFVNNTLYGYSSPNNQLLQYDSSGNASVVSSWKDAAGSAAASPSNLSMQPYGGKLAIMRQTSPLGTELWMYDGSGVFKVAEFPVNFVGWQMVESLGVLYISGSFFRKNGSNNDQRPAVFFYDGSTLGLLWEANTFLTTSTDGRIAVHPGIAQIDGGVVFSDDTTGTYMFYNPASGGVHSYGGYTVAGDSSKMAASIKMFLNTRNSATSYFAPDPSTTATSGYYISSLIDYDNSLVKAFRGIRVEWTAATDGDGGSVDLAYQLDSLTGAWTTLKTGAVSGTEYTISGVSGHSVAIKVTLNKGTSTLGPTLKTVAVRAAPELTTYRLRTYVLDLSGIGFQDPVRLADGTLHPLEGHKQADNLNTAIVSQMPITVSDRFVNLQTSLNGSTTTDSFSAFCIPSDCEIYDVAEGWDNPQYPGGYVAKITLREV